MKKSLAEIPLSVLNLVNYPQGQSIEKGFSNARDLARQTEHWGYKRYWMAEHHNLEGIASAATSVLIAYIPFIILEACWCAVALVAFVKKSLHSR